MRDIVRGGALGASRVSAPECRVWASPLGAFPTASPSPRGSDENRLPPPHSLASSYASTPHSAHSTHAPHAPPTRAWSPLQKTSPHARRLASMRLAGRSGVFAGGARRGRPRQRRRAQGPQRGRRTDRRVGDTCRKAHGAPTHEGGRERVHEILQGEAGDDTAPA